VNNDQADTTTRGGIWVVAQFALMIAGLVAGPIWRAQWNGWPTIAAGIDILLLGAWLGLRGKHDLGAHRTPFPQPKEDGQLITTGIYARLRHPLYASVIALGFAWALLWRSWPALGLAAAQVLFFDAKARCEERWLRELFPDYATYARRVKRFIPGLY
jgi:protein-S-isoprenylcysteine O-methyltransferase Ste14